MKIQFYGNGGIGSLECVPGVVELSPTDGKRVL